MSNNLISRDNIIGYSGAVINLPVTDQEDSFGLQTADHYLKISENYAKHTLESDLKKIIKDIEEASKKGQLSIVATDFKSQHREEILTFLGKRKFHTIAVGESLIIVNFSNPDRQNIY